jgi:hypothetical protein
MKMKVDTSVANIALKSIFKDKTQVIALDANFLIAPNRTRPNVNANISFSKFKDIWLEPMFDTFPNLSVHTAVYEEIVNSPEKSYVDSKVNANPPRLIVLSDDNLSELEKAIRNTKEAVIARPTNYSPDLDNKDDRGEVKTLAYISTKDIIYFASNDYNAIRLVEETEKLGTSLENVRMLKFYDLIFYFYKTSEEINKKQLRMLYKYLYYLTKDEQEKNPSWNEFIIECEKLYYSDYGIYNPK